MDLGSSNSKSATKSLIRSDSKADKVFDRFSKGQHNSYASQKYASKTVSQALTDTSVEITQNQQKLLERQFHGYMLDLLKQ